MAQSDEGTAHSGGRGEGWEGTSARVQGAPAIGHCIVVFFVADLIVWKGDLDVLLRLYVHAGALQAPPTTAAGVAPVKNTHFKVQCHEILFIIFIRGHYIESNYKSNMLRD